MNQNTIFIFSLVILFIDAQNSNNDLLMSTVLENQIDSIISNFEILLEENNGSFSLSEENISELDSQITPIAIESLNDYMMKSSLYNFFSINQLNEEEKQLIRSKFYIQLTLILKKLLKVLKTTLTY